MTHGAGGLHRSASGAICRFVSLLSLIAALAASPALMAQTGGEGSISGTVTDSTGALILNATITATYAATNVSTVRAISGDGSYTIAPLPPGTYSLTVIAKGFKTLRQDHLSVDGLSPLSFNPVLTAGETAETVVVTNAPPMLDTSGASLGMVMENTTYATLPLQMNNAQRDATAFASLTAGAQVGTFSPIVGGTGNLLGQLYLDGMPAETIDRQGENRLASEGIDLDAVDQFQVVTSTPPPEYSGAGALNFTMKSGGARYHGQVSDFVRNTAFDAWSFVAKAATMQNDAGLTVPVPKPTENQNELSATFGGKIPHTGNKAFFFFAYDRYRERKGASYSTFTIPTTLMRSGDFTELNQNLLALPGGGLTGDAGDPSGGGLNEPKIYDPTSNVCAGVVCNRTPFQGVKNGIPTYNVIPTSYLSPIALKMESFMPAPSNPSVLAGNYLGGYPGGSDSNAEDWRVDFITNARQRLSTVGAIGAVYYVQNYATGGAGAGAYGLLPLPYVAGNVQSLFPRVFGVEDTYTLRDRLINQVKYSVTRFPQPASAPTDGKTQYMPATFGITDVPPGQASTELPGASFGQTGAVTTSLTAWTEQGATGSTSQTNPTTYAVLDNLQWLKGNHDVTLGLTYEWEESNGSFPSGYSGLVELPFNSYSTARYAIGAGTLSASSGNSYASFLLGAVGGAPTLPLQQAVSEVGGRYRVAAPYAQDTWKATRKLTLDLGIRWDYFSPYHEVKDRWTFLNPALRNAATGTPGTLQFAGHYGGAGVSCGCRTPVETYWKNFGPRIGVAYAIDGKTVFRLGLAQVFSQAGGVGGHLGNTGGTGLVGFNTDAKALPESTGGLAAHPSFYLNNSAFFEAKGLANTDLFGKGFIFPAASAPGASSQLVQTGNYLDSNNNLVTAGGVSLADPYISGRAPEFTFFNIGFERSITRDMTLSVNYAGDESHFVSTGSTSGNGSNVRGYWANQLDPVYLAGLGQVTDSTGTKPVLIAAATSANVAKAQATMARISIPAFFEAAANANPDSSTLTLAQALTAFPQYSGVTDLWGSNVGNFSYHSLQITLLQRMAHGLSFNVNYTYSKNLGDDVTFRSGFAIPGTALSGGGHDWQPDRIDRSWTSVSVPQILHAFGVYSLPFGSGRMGANSRFIRSVAKGWQISGIYSYGSGTPVAVVSNHCAATNFPLQGQCMPDVVPGAKNARVGGSYGAGPKGTTACNLAIGPGCAGISYFDSSKFARPAMSGGLYLIGNAPRTQPINLRNPGNQDLDASVHRSFTLPKDIGTFVFEVDCLNVWNKVTFSAPAATFGATNFGVIGGIANTPRDLQFAGHFNF